MQPICECANYWLNKELILSLCKLAHWQIKMLAHRFLNSPLGRLAGHDDFQRTSGSNVFMVQERYVQRLSV